MVFNEKRNLKHFVEEGFRTKSNGQIGLDEPDTEKVEIVFATMVHKVLHPGFVQYSHQAVVGQVLPIIQV